MNQFDTTSADNLTEARIKFNGVVQQFVQAPTNENKQNLLLAAEEYRDAWIQNMADGGANKLSNVPDPQNWAPEAIAKFYSEQLGQTIASTKYFKKLESVRQLDGGLPVKLALQKRSGAREKVAYWTVSWRTKYSPHGTNRRFYFSSGKCWVVPARIALELLDDLSEKGGLDENYFDNRPGNLDIQTIVSPTTRIDVPDQYELECARIFSTDEDWGNAPAIVVLSDTNSNWQKAMIVNTETLVCTFRSLTKDATYMPKKDLNKGNEWWLDNAMMDANVQQMRIFHSHLKKILENAR